jgi:hypothetical protein
MLVYPSLASMHPCLTRHQKHDLAHIDISPLIQAHHVLRAPNMLHEEPFSIHHAAQVPNAA